MKTLILTSNEQQVLEGFARKGTTEHRCAQRARNVLLSATGIPDKTVAEKLSISPQTVGKWRRRFIDLRVDGLSDLPRPGAPRRISSDQVKDVVDKTIRTKPRASTHWSSSQMAKATGLSATTVKRIWRTFELKPHKTKHFQISNDPNLVSKIVDIAGLYMNPPDNAIVLCVDEKTQIQALDRTQPLIPMRPGQVERRTYEYTRHGTTTLFAALDVATGKVIGKCKKRHRSEEFKKFLDEINSVVPPDLDVHIVLDNYATHKTQLIKQWLEKRPRYHLHFTPTHSSWLNQVEIWFGLLTRRQIKRGVHRSVKQLENSIRDFLDQTNDIPKPFKWTKSADDNLASILHFVLINK